MASSEWQPVPNLPYEVNHIGEIRNIKNGRILKPFLAGSYGYPHVTIVRDGWYRNFTVHSIVAAAFYGTRPLRYDVDHLDGDPTNNRPDNLEYVSHKENMRRSKRMRRGESHPQALVTDADVREIRRMEQAGEISDLRDVMKRYGIERKTLYNLRKRVTWKHVE